MQNAWPVFAPELVLQPRLTQGALPFMLLTPRPHGKAVDMATFDPTLVSGNVPTADPFGAL
jgi:hypothetical protein